MRRRQRAGILPLARVRKPAMADYRNSSSVAAVRRAFLSRRVSPLLRDV
jgi:hypothetical protein